MLNNTLWIVGVFLILALAKLLRFWFKKTKGSRGEGQLVRRLKKLRGEKRILRNAYVPSTGGKTKEIDVLLIANSGVYVFEMKNYSGWIYGSECKETWTQTLAGGKVKNKFYNPVWQNHNHIKALKSYIGVSDEDLPIHSIVVFGDDCRLKNLTLSGNTPVIQLKSVNRAVSEIAKRYSNKLPRVESVYQKLLPLTQVTKKEKVAHVKNIKTTIDKREKSIANKICPRCAAPLVERTAKKGANVVNRFWGCSNYPKCKFTTSVKQY
ncbi:MAG: NERD domain-containing protein [Oscillospiraceae bacterium]|nr:NERD domain-containing protein [Oscillospiraceae bacterium]